MKFEPTEPDSLEAGCIACEEQRLDAAAKLFLHAVQQSWSTEQPLLSRFLQELLHSSPVGDSEWFVRAEQAPTTHAQFSCLKMVVRLNPLHLEAWEKMITLCQSLSDVSLKETYVRELWNCQQVSSPDTLAIRILSLMTSEEKLLLGEQHATEFRNKGLFNSTLEGIPLQRFRDWVVTTSGVESMIRSYDIYWRDVWQRDLLWHPPRVP